MQSFVSSVTPLKLSITKEIGRNGIDSSVKRQ
eukprot:CAMPEP_0174269430 /NCGR_PEP_ID=MMETSP0439-20130205/40965_1 /TAXON_ID=0 /ORGANISM="Stereomyxa ramosa, Strain Chinc5" /LENGTH=31 /DNA_ID= /DNA_START= /DNA_END= /DNA_ORIENTATION=